MGEYHEQHVGILLQRTQMKLSADHKPAEISRVNPNEYFWRLSDFSNILVNMNI